MKSNIFKDVKTITTLTDKDYVNSKIKGNRSGLLMLFASWCGACHARVDMYTKLSELMQKHIKSDRNIICMAANAEAEINPKFAQLVSAYPTFIYVTNGEIKEINIMQGGDVLSLINLMISPENKAEFESIIRERPLH